MTFLFGNFDTIAPAMVLDQWLHYVSDGTVLVQFCGTT